MAFSHNRGSSRASGGKAALAAGIREAWLNSYKGPPHICTESLLCLDTDMFSKCNITSDKTDSQANHKGDRQKDNKNPLDRHKIHQHIHHRELPP